MQLSIELGQVIYIYILIEWVSKICVSFHYFYAKMKRVFNKFNKSQNSHYSSPQTFWGMFSSKWMGREMHSCAIISSDVHYEGYVVPKCHMESRALWKIWLDCNKGLVPWDSWALLCQSSHSLNWKFQSAIAHNSLIEKCNPLNFYTHLILSGH